MNSSIGRSRRMGCTPGRRRELARRCLPSRRRRLPLRARASSSRAGFRLEALMPPDPLLDLGPHGASLDPVPARDRRSRDPSTDGATRPVITVTANASPIGDGTDEIARLRGHEPILQRTADVLEDEIGRDDLLPSRPPRPSPSAARPRGSSSAASRAGPSASNVSVLHRHPRPLERVRFDLVARSSSAPTATSRTARRRRPSSRRAAPRTRSAALIPNIPCLLTSRGNRSRPRAASPSAPHRAARPRTSRDRRSPRARRDAR